MTRKSEDSPRGQEASRLTGAFWNRGVYIPNRDIERGDNEGLNARERTGLSIENSHPYGQLGDDLGVTGARRAINDRFNGSRE